MSTLSVDIAELCVTADPDAVLVTYALGSCVAVIVHDPVRRAGGMIHYMLPLSEASPEKAQARPAMFGDVGVPLLFRTLYDLGCRKENLVVKVAGAGTLYNDHGIFEIGRRNYTVLRKLFWKNGILIAAEDVGGAKSRTVRLYVASGRCTVTCSGTETEL